MPTTDGYASKFWLRAWENNPNRSQSLTRVYFNLTKFTYRHVSKFWILILFDSRDLHESRKLKNKILPEKNENVKICLNCECIIATNM